MLLTVWNIVPVGSIPTNNYFQSFPVNFIEEFLKNETKINEIFLKEKRVVCL
jgi:hypothetical protein